MSGKAARFLLLILVLFLVCLWTLATAQERGGNRRYGTSDRKNSQASSSSGSGYSSSSGEENSRGEGRYSGRESSGDETEDEESENVTADAEGNYDFHFAWKWNGNREIECLIPASFIEDSDRELENIAQARDPYKALGIDWSKYDENERNHVFWQALYRYLFGRNLSRLTAMTEKLKEIKAAENMSDQKFLEYVLSLVQNLRYERPGGGLDILTQPEALYRKLGDCDTKSLLLTTLLSSMGYDTVIFYSSYYSHAMAGIYMNGTGTYVKFNGKKYYFMETTYSGWKPGVLPPEYNNTRYWQVCVLRGN